MPLSRVKLHEVDFSKRPFVFSLPQRGAFLLESVKRYGVIEPPVVTETREGLFPICGEGRLLAARTLGIDAVEAIVLGEVEPLKALHLSLESNLFRGINLAEKAELVSRFASYLSPEEIVRRIFPRLGLPEKPRWYFFLKRLSESPEEIKLAVAEETLNPKVAEILTRLPSGKQLFLLALFKRYRFTFSEEMEVLAGLLDLSKRHDLDPEDLVAREFSETRDRKEFLRRLRGLLRPHLYSFEKELLEIRQALSKRGLRLEAHPPYERDRFRISFDFGTTEELKQKIQDLEEFSKVYSFPEVRRPE